MNLFSFSKNDSPILLVLQGNALQVLQIKQGEEKTEILAFNELVLMDGVVEEEKIIDAGAFGTALTDLFAGAKPEVINATTLYVNIPYHLFYSFVSDFPYHVKEDSMRRSLEDSVRKNTPMSVSELVIDFNQAESDRVLSYAAYASPRQWRGRF